MPPSSLARLRRICLALPQAIEVEAWGSATFRVGKIFAMHAAADSQHGDGREGVWVKSTHFTQDLLVRGMPNRYFVPAYVGPGGWTGVYLDGQTDWDALTELLRDAYRMSASKKLAAALTDDDEPAAKAPPRRRPATGTKRASSPKSGKRAKSAAKKRARVR